MPDAVEKYIRQSSGFSGKNSCSVCRASVFAAFWFQDSTLRFPLKDFIVAITFTAGQPINRLFRYIQQYKYSRPSSTFDKIIMAQVDRKLERTHSAAYREGTKEAIERVLASVEATAEKRVKDGFSEVNFTLGVLNCFFILFMFNEYPQHLWIVYIVEALYLFPAKFRFLINAKPLNQAFYYLDFCWVMNMGLLLVFLVLFAGRNHISDEIRHQLFLAGFGTACGPLIGATATLPFVTLVFHHLESMTSVFIHFYPPLLFYILRWKADAVKEAWPNIFDLDYDLVFWPNGSFTGCVFGNTIILYLMWIIPYFFWQLYFGLDLPKTHRTKKLADGSPAPTVYDTVFHANMRNGLCVTIGNVLWKRPKELSLQQVKTNDFEMRDFYFYMGVHLFCGLVSTVVLAYPCFLNKYAHGVVLWFLAALCTYRGSKRYTYYSTKMYARIIRKQFSDEINGELTEKSPLQGTVVQDNVYHSFGEQKKP